jgi:hypothetical protein
MELVPSPLNCCHVSCRDSSLMGLYFGQRVYPSFGQTLCSPSGELICQHILHQVDVVDSLSVEARTQELSLKHRANEIIVLKQKQPIANRGVADAHCLCIGLYPKELVFSELSRNDRSPKKSGNILGKFLPDSLPSWKRFDSQSATIVQEPTLQDA